jgi:flagellar biogenesis protein FliO
VSLGEKRFVAVVQVDGRHFLLAGGPTNIVLLAQLDAKDAFEDVLKKTLTAPAKQVAKRKQPANFAMQAHSNRTNRREDPQQKAAPARSKQPAKQISRQNSFAQGPASAPVITRLNGTEDFGDVLQKAVAASRQPKNHAGKQNSKPAPEQGYFA